MNKAYRAALEERISEACYQHILPHMAKYNAEPDLEQCLPLMDARIFAAFATQACRDVAGLIVKAARNQYHRRISGFTAIPVALRELDVGDADEAKVIEMLATCLTDFASALERYAAIIARFQQMAGQAHQAAWNNGSAIGDWAGNLFGGVAGVIVAVAGGYAAGSVINREMQAEGERLQQAFNAMLQAYDQAMANLSNSALHILASHHQAVINAVRSC